MVSETKVERRVNTEDNKHQVQLAFIICYLLPATRVYFVIKLARANGNRVVLPYPEVRCSRICRLVLASVPDHTVPAPKEGEVMVKLVIF